MISALMELLGNYYLSGDFTQAETIARTICRAIPDDVIAIQILGLAYFKSGRVSDALRLFQQADRAPPLKPASQCSADGATESNIELAQSVLYREATRKHSDYGKVWYDLGAALISLKRPKQSIRALRTALEVRPSFPDALLALGTTGLQIGDHAAAHDGFSGLLALEPDNVIARQSLKQLNHSHSDLLPCA